MGSILHAGEPHEAFFNGICSYKVNWSEERGKSSLHSHEDGGYEIIFCYLSIVLHSNYLLIVVEIFYFHVPP